MRDKNLLIGQLAVEHQTIAKMTKIYCQHFHKVPYTNCQSCQAFVGYAEKKLDRCVYGQAKPACKNCPIHCYKPTEKQLAQQIMRFAGPKMLFKHPILAIKHLLKAKKSFPEKIPSGLSNYHIRKSTKQ